LIFLVLANQLIDKSISWTVPEELITELKTLSQRKEKNTRQTISRNRT